MGILDDVIGRERAEDERRARQKERDELRWSRFGATFRMAENYADFTKRPIGPMGNWRRAEQMLREFRQMLPPTEGIPTSVVEIDGERIAARGWARHPHPPHHDHDPRIASPELVAEGDAAVAAGDEARLLRIEDVDGAADTSIRLWLVYDQGRWFPAEQVGHGEIGWFTFGAYDYERLLSRYIIDGPSRPTNLRDYY
jgi:hypothetical protein